MSYYDLDLRTRLLLDSRVKNGVRIVVASDDESQIMKQMVEEGLFTGSDSGYWWTPQGERAAEQAWDNVPVERFETSYRDHPQVTFHLSGTKEEMCYVACASRPERPLWVRESLGSYIVDNPGGRGNSHFDSADEAIEWALTA